jgi:hypothetical protein
VSKILMLHGINHNMFGKRDPKQYGAVTLAEIDAQLQALARELGAEVTSFQTNGDAATCERIHPYGVRRRHRRRAHEGRRLDALPIGLGSKRQVTAFRRSNHSLQPRIWAELALPVSADRRQPDRHLMAATVSSRPSPTAALRRDCPAAERQLSASFENG